MFNDEHWTRVNDAVDESGMMLQVILFFHRFILTYQ